MSRITVNFHSCAVELRYVDKNEKQFTQYKKKCSKKKVKWNNIQKNFFYQKSDEDDSKKMLREIILYLCTMLPDFFFSFKHAKD